MKEKKLSVKYIPERIINRSRRKIKSSRAHNSKGIPSNCSFMNNMSRRIVSKHLLKSTKHINVRFFGGPFTLLNPILYKRGANPS